MTYRETVEQLISRNCSANLFIRVSTYNGRGDSSPGKKHIENLVAVLRQNGYRVNYGQGGYGEDVSINDTIITPHTEAGWEAIENCIPEPLFLRPDSGNAAYSGKFYGLSTNKHDKLAIRNELFYDDQTDWSRKW